MAGNGKAGTLQRMIRSKSEALNKWIEGFLRDCRVRDLSPHTVKYYKAQLYHFAAYAAGQGITAIGDVTPDLIRAYLIHLEEAGHNPGGRRSKYIALRAFFNWHQAEAETDATPMTKVRPPKVEREPIQGASLDDVRAMLATCGSDFLGTRDRAVILCLLDTGARAGEFLNVDLADVDLVTGAVTLRKTKGKRPRTVFAGRKSRRALRRYLAMRDDDCPALWVSRRGSRLVNLEGMLKRRGRLAGLHNPPSPHDFRRAHALIMLRAGTDVISLARLMGHATLEVLTRYLRQNSDDLQAAHDKAGPVDSLI